MLLYSFMIGNLLRDTSFSPAKLLEALNTRLAYMKEGVRKVFFLVSIDIESMLVELLFSATDVVEVFLLLLLSFPQDKQSTCNLSRLNLSRSVRLGLARLIQLKSKQDKEGEQVNNKGRVCKWLLVAPRLVAAGWTPNIENSLVEWVSTRISFSSPSWKALSLVCLSTFFVTKPTNKQIQRVSQHSNWLARYQAVLEAKKETLVKQRRTWARFLYVRLHWHMSQVKKLN